MRIINKVIVAMLVLSLLAAVVSNGTTQSQSAETLTITSYRDIPGVTEDDIKAIEELKGRYSYFIYGMLESGEASMIAKLIRTPEREGRFVWPENETFTDNYALISKSELSDHNVNAMPRVKVGLVQDSAYAQVFRRWLPYHSHFRAFTYIHHQRHIGHVENRVGETGTQPGPLQFPNPGRPCCVNVYLRCGKERDQVQV